MTMPDNQDEMRMPYQIKGPTYYWLDSWVMSNIIQLATQDFCRHFLNLQNDPCGRMYDQMTQAARSGQANIAEGNSRHFTSRETEMKLTDVAKASISELEGDYCNWLLSHGQAPWSNSSEDYKRVNSIRLDRANFTSDVMHESALHILRQKEKFSEWLNTEDSFKMANGLLILCDRLKLMLSKQMATLLNDFRVEGGFTEALTAERLEARKQKSIDASAPTCPKCGKPMLKRMAKKGINSGHEFWSCSDYPRCLGTRSI